MLCVLRVCCACKRGTLTNPLMLSECYVFCYFDNGAPTQKNASLSFPPSFFFSNLPFSECQHFSTYFPHFPLVYPSISPSVSPLSLCLSPLVFISLLSHGFRAHRKLSQKLVSSAGRMGVLQVQTREEDASCLQDDGRVGMCQDSKSVIVRCQRGKRGKYDDELTVRT